MSQGAVPIGGPLPIRPVRLRAWDRLGSLAREGLFFLGVLALARIATLWLLILLTGGREFTDDIGTSFAPMLENPLAILLGEAGAVAHYPPLLPLLLSPVLLLRPLVSDFVAFRLLFVGYELLAWPLVWMILCRAARGAAPRRLLALAYIASPMTWMTSVVMGQEETAGLLFAAAIVVSLLRDRRLLALTLCSLAACALKVFFAVPLAVLILVPQPGRPAFRGLLQRALVGLGPLILVYGSVTLAQLLGAGGVALARFDPPIMFCVGLWTALSDLHPLSTRFMEWASAALAAGCVAAVMLAIRIHRVPLGGAGIARVACTLLLCVFATFYHVNPEYYALALPMLLLLFSPGGTVLALAGLSIPWAVNLFYGIAAASPADVSGKQVFVELYQSLTSIDPTTMYVVLLWISVAVMAALACAAVRGLLGQPPARFQG